MEGNYDVFFGKQITGRVSVQRQGLYYRFSCRCKLTGDVVCRLQVRCGSSLENLGVIVPMDGCFGLDTKLPAKRFGNGKMEFCLLPKHERMVGMFVPVYPEEPFAYIARLKHAYLVRKDGQTGIMLR